MLKNIAISIGSLFITIAPTLATEIDWSNSAGSAVKPAQGLPGVNTNLLNKAPKAKSCAETSRKTVKLGEKQRSGDCYRSPLNIKSTSQGAAN